MPVRVSIALPVHNGENFLAQALRSIAAQTCTDYELLISDNASTDRTWDIIQRHAALDPRIRPERLDTNIGAAANFNRLVHSARAALFKWAAHDDLLHPQFIQRCAGLLDQRPDAVACHTETTLIDAAGTAHGIYANQPAFEEPTPAERFAAVITKPHRCFHVFGLIRTEALRQTELIGPYTGSDRTLIAELALRGRLPLIAQPLFARRDHPEASIRKHLDERDRAAWFDPALAGQAVAPTWRRLLAYLHAIDRARGQAHIDALAERDCHRALWAWIDARHQTGAPVRDLLAREALGGLDSNHAGR